MTCENGVLCRERNFPRSAVYNYPYLIFSICKRSENFINFIYPVGDILSYRMYSCFEVSGEFCQFKGNKANWCSVLWPIFFLRRRSNWPLTAENFGGFYADSSRSQPFLHSPWRKFRKRRKVANPFDTSTFTIAIKKSKSEVWLGRRIHNGVVDRTWTGDLLGHNQTR